MLSAGVVIEGGSVRHSILAPSVRVQEFANVERSILFDGVTVGVGARLQNCIVDKFVHIPQGERIGFDLEHDATRFIVSDGGVVVVPKNFQFAGNTTTQESSLRLSSKSGSTVAQATGLSP